MATAAQRLPALCSRIWSSSSSQVYNPALRSARAAAYRAYHPSRRRRQDTGVSQGRYGTANEPPPHWSGGGVKPVVEGEAPGAQPTRLPKIGDKLQKSGEAEVQQDAEKEDNKAADKREATTVEGRNPAQISDPMLDAGEAHPDSPPPGAPDMPVEKPLAAYLHGTGSPADNEQHKDQEAKDTEHAEEHENKAFDEHSPPVKAPHIEQPRYVHHFDTYGLVKRLEADGGWRQDQAITVMKAVRLMLADNTDLAKEALVSKSQLENEAYLFKAACAELKTEVMARRKSEQEKMRTERTQLQHEVDILTQRLGQESTGLKDDLKGLFDDRKMGVRNEQRDMERQISQLNYKITVELQADAKSEIEGLRLVMTRRVILTLGIIVLMVIGGLKVASSASKAAEEAERKGASRPGSSSSMVSGGTQTTDGMEDYGRRVAPGEVVVGRDGNNPGFVSLG